MPPPLALLKALGPAKFIEEFASKEYPQLIDKLIEFTKPRSLAGDYASSLRMAMEDSQKPLTRTSVLSDDKGPLSLFQLSPGFEDIEGNYLNNLVSLRPWERGAGRQAIMTAREQGPFELVATPFSRPFYEKLSQEGIKGFGPHPDPEFQGVRYVFRKNGGLV